MNICLKNRVVKNLPIFLYTIVTMFLLYGFLDLVFGQTFDVYFGTDPTALELVSENQTDSSFQLPELQYSTTYYWQIIARNEFGETEGDIWNFTTEADPVPVELMSFTVSVGENSITLNWETATEINNYGFEIEQALYSPDNFSKIGFVEGYGNSNSPKYYSFIHNLFISGEYFFRLKQIDNNGEFEYSEIISGIIGGGKSDTLFIYPNPFNPATTLYFDIRVPGNIKIEVFDILGNKVKTVNSYYEVGLHKEQIDMGGFSAGVYIIQLETPVKTLSQKVVLVK